MVPMLGDGLAQSMKDQGKAEICGEGIGNGSATPLRLKASSSHHAHGVLTTFNSLCADWSDVDPLTNLLPITGT